MSIRQLLHPVFVLLCGGILFGANAFATDAENAAAHRGKALHVDKCAACHAKKSGLGDGDVLYTRSDRLVKNSKQLDAMVARCNSEIRLDLFPEDEADLAQFLNKNFYKFKQAQK